MSYRNNLHQMDSRMKTQRNLSWNFEPRFPLTEQIILVRAQRTMALHLVIKHVGIMMAFGVWFLWGRSSSFNLLDKVLTERLNRTGTLSDVSGYLSYKTGRRRSSWRRRRHITELYCLMGWANAKEFHKTQRKKEQIVKIVCSASLNL